MAIASTASDRRAHEPGMRSGSVVNPCAVRVLTHIRKLDDCFGQFLVRVVCGCGAVREIGPEALARLVGWKMTLKELALRMRCSKNPH